MQQVGGTAERLNGSSVALTAVESGACTSEGSEFIKTHPRVNFEPRAQKKRNAFTTNIPHAEAKAESGELFLS